MPKPEIPISEIIEDKIYLSGIQSALDVSNIIELGIDIIVTILNFNPLKNKKVYDGTGVQCIFYYADDTEKFNISKYFDSFTTLVNENPDKKILVHCYCGISRSVSLVSSYLINSYADNELLEEFDVTRILEIIKNKRCCSNPNKGFIQQLVDYRNVKINV
jgi:protein-tyrosine phosphatase